MFSMLRGELQVGETAALVVLRNVTWVLVGIALALRGWGAEGPMIGLLLGYIGVIGLGLVRTRTTPTVPDMSTAKSLVGYGKYEMLNNATWQVFSWTDVLVLGVFVNSTGVAAYEIAWRVSRAAIVASNTATVAVFPHASHAAADGNIEQLRKHSGSLLTVVALMVVPAFFGVAALGEEILSVAFSPEFVIATTALVILTGQSFIQAVQSVFGQLLLALNRPELPTRAASVALVSNVALNVILIPLFGLTGAATATAVAYLLNLVIQYGYITKLLQPQIPWREALVSALGSLLMYAALQQLTLKYDISSYVELFSAIGLGVVLFFAVSVASKQTRLIMARFVRKLL
jgi:O-antigen/teichoic acid export membrane protein